MLNLATIIRWTFLSRGKTPGRGQAVSEKGREQRGMEEGQLQALGCLLHN